MLRTSISRQEYDSRRGALQVRKLTHPWRNVSAVVVLVLFAGMIWSLANNPNIGMTEIRQYLTTPMILKGVLVTIYLTAASMIMGTAGGVVIAVMGLSDNIVLLGIAKFYIWVFRGTPMLVQLIFWAYAGAIYPVISIGIPFTDIVFWSEQTSNLINPIVAALLALTFNQAAYSAEIIRGGIISVDHGQSEAAWALGMAPGRTMRRIVLPQAMRSILPPLGNEAISMLKATSLVSVIGGADLMTTVQYIYSQNYKVIPLLIVASLWYLFLTSLMFFPQRWLERRYGRGVPGRATGGGL